MVEDDEDYAAQIHRELSRTVGADTCHLVRSSTVRSAQEAVKRDSVDVVLLDLDLPDSTGLSTLEALLHAAPSVAVVVLTGTAESGMGVDAVRFGAQDYLRKDEASGSVIWRTVVHAVERKRSAELTYRLGRGAQESLLANVATAVSHRLNNPLAAVIGNLSHGRILHAELLQLAEATTSRLAQNTPEAQSLSVCIERLRELSAVMEDAASGAEMIEDAARDLRSMLSFEDERDGLVDPSMLIRLVARSLVHGDQAALYLDVPELPMLQGSERELGQAVGALINNALQSHHSDERVVAVSVHAELVDDQLQIDVRDNGSGIEEDARPRIFEPFFVGGAQTQRLGLGLALARQSIQQHGGTLELVSTSAAGSTFRIALPLDVTAIG